MNAQSVLARGEGLAWQLVADEGVILDIDRRLLRGLNPTAWRVWELMDGERSLGQIAAQIACDWQAPAERVLADTLEFAGDLSARRLVRVVG